LSPTVSKRILEGFSAVVLQSWPKGFYFLPTDLRTAVIALHQLPLTEETLWLRLMARGKIQRQAIAELLALPANHPMRQNTIEQLAVLRIDLNVVQNLSKDERALAMNLSPVYEKWRQETLQEGRQEGELKGRQEGRQEGERSLVLRLLSRRIGNLSPNVVSKVEALSLPQLELLGEALLDFTSVDDLTTWLQSNQ
jgi:predicted transposase YdaD